MISKRLSKLKFNRRTLEIDLGVFQRMQLSMKMLQRKEIAEQKLNITNQLILRLENDMIKEKNQKNDIEGDVIDPDELRIYELEQLEIKNSEIEELVIDDIEDGETVPKELETEKELAINDDIGGQELKTNDPEGIEIICDKIRNDEINDEVDVNKINVEV